MERRKFLIGLGIALIAGPSLFTLKGCGSSSNNNAAPANPATGFDVQSSVAGAHTHSVTVLLADLTAQPSAGVTYQSTTNSNHFHKITLTQQQLATINGGGTVTVTSIPDATGHSHDWTITKP
jgi:hypothetical protein